MRILQLTDTHVVRAGKAFGTSDSAENLRKTIDYILAYDLSPDMAVISGDVSNDGSKESYITVQKQILRLNCPFFIMPGNHDNRDTLKKVFGSAGCVDTDRGGKRFENEEVCLFFVDTSVPGCSHGQISEATLAWIKRSLPDIEKPTIFFMHHVPFATGYHRMDKAFDGLDHLIPLLQGRPKLMIASGHIHTGYLTLYRGILCMTCPSVSMMMSPDRKALQGNTFYTEPAGFAIHDVNRDGICTNFCIVPAMDKTKGPFYFSDTRNDSA